MNRREMLVLGLPLLLLGVGAMFLSAREKKRIERESGPLRMIVSDFQTIAVSPKEAWQGYDLKYRVDLEIQGQGSPKFDFSSVRALDDEKKTYLSVVRMDGKIQRFSGVQVDEGTYMEPHLSSPLKIVDAYGDSNKSGLYRYILIDRDAFPTGRATLKLHSQFRVFRFPISPISNWAHVIDDDLRPVNINQEVPKLVSSSLSIAAPLASEYRKSESLYGVEKEMTKLELIWDIKNLQTQKYDVHNFIGSKFEDSKGNEIRVNSMDDTHKGKHFYSLSCASYPAYDNKFKPIPNQITTRIKMDLNDVPTTYGAIFLSSNYSLNNSWAAPFRLEVRPAWVCKTARQLKLEKVVVDINTVSVYVRYIGKEPIEYLALNSIRQKYYSTAVGEDDLCDSPLKQGFNRLIVNWSQHLEDKNEALFFDLKQLNRSFEPYCSVLSVTESGNKRYRINYAINHPNPTGMKFKAEVGIWGDGFIPIEATIAKTK